MTPPPPKTKKCTPSESAKNLLPSFDAEWQRAEAELALGDEREARAMLSLRDFRMPSKTPESVKPEDTPDSVTIKSEPESEDAAPEASRKRPRQAPPPNVAGGFQLGGLTGYHTVLSYLSAEGEYRVFIRYHTVAGRETSIRVTSNQSMHEAFDVYMCCREFVMQSNLDRGVVLLIPSRPTW